MQPYMKNTILILLAAFAFCGKVAAQANPDSVKAMFAKYPQVKSPQCADCYLWVNPFFSTITDEKLKESVVSYAYLDQQRDKLIDQLKVDRKKYGGWKPFPGYPNEDKFYNDINKGITATTSKYAKGHYIGFMLCAWSVYGAILSCTYDVNEGIEVQGQNEGTELQVEELTRALVGNKVFMGKMHYKGPIYPRVDYWKGSWGSIKIFNADGITKNYSAFYWNLVKYGNELHAYWFPNDATATAKVGYAHYEIPADTLTQRLGFDPQKLLKSN